MHTLHKVFCAIGIFCIFLIFYKSNNILSIGYENEKIGRQKINSQRIWEFWETRNNLNNPRGQAITNRWLKQKYFPGGIQCADEPRISRYQQWGNYWVLSNYVVGTETFSCDEAVTYTTQGEFSFLDNLVEISERWDGPISISLYTPGSDFGETMRRIMFLRHCGNSSKIKERVSFHLFFDYSHMPNSEIVGDPEKFAINCEDKSDFGGTRSYRNTKNLTYPINLARMIAREMATTYYVFPCDIELYPSRNLVQGFIDMINRNDKVLQNTSPKVFVLPIFEMEKGLEIPNDKNDLLRLIQNRTAVPFHHYVCAACHRIPKAEEWAQTTPKNVVEVFHSAKRHGEFTSWEPFFISTKYDPGFDTRMTWEGKEDKYTQAFILCLLDYDFLILDNAFVIHKPGIKRRPSQRSHLENVQMGQQKKMLANKIYPDLKILYGTNANC